MVGEALHGGVAIMNNPSKAGLTWVNPFPTP